jgi:hypothetical protein
MNAHVLMLLAQIPDPVNTNTLKILVDAGVAVILAIALLFLAYSILQQNRNKSKDDEAERKQLLTVIENVNDLTKALISDREHSLKIIEASSETQRLITVAINENTGSNRSMTGTMETMSRDLREYTSLHSDSVEQLVGAIERSESQMVAFGSALKGAIDDIHNNAKDHEEIVELVQKVIDELMVIKLDMRLAFNQLIPPMNPPKPSEQLITLPQEVTVTLHTADAAPGGESGVAA